jgi:hypothetical protein
VPASGGWDEAGLCAGGGHAPGAASWAWGCQRSAPVTARIASSPWCNPNFGAGHADIVGSLCALVLQIAGLPVRPVQPAVRQTWSGAPA